jgi:Protein of unknown function (DUF3619)
MTGKKSEEEFLTEVRTTLDRSTENLGPETLRRLRTARFEALELAGAGRFSWFRLHRWITAGGLTTITVLALGISLWLGAPVQNPPLRQPDDLEILASQDQLDLYKDLDFYRWLAADAKVTGEQKR